jgi:polysaccharide export outer membrane protein
MQDIESKNQTNVNYTNSLIQPNDVLFITVSALNPEAAQIYNMQAMGGGNGGGGGGMNNPGMLALMGYLVTPDYNINFPVLGEIPVKDMTTTELSEDITKRLINGGHLKNPTVLVRLVNAKFTIIGNANGARTITFTEQNITLVQALGLAGGFDVNVIRDDVVIMREEKGVRQISHIDLTKTDWMDGPYYFIKPNDVILINPNDPAVKRAGYITGPAAIIGFAASLLGLAFLLTN